MQEKRKQKPMYLFRNPFLIAYLCTIYLLILLSQVRNLNDRKLILLTPKKERKRLVANDVVLTPMMKQFFELKAKHPDAVMLFRCGDFYETYSEDAIVASEILGITLTKRANGQAKHVEMAGFPFHALDTYLPKLVRAGKRVAICDQLEDPKLTKKLFHHRGKYHIISHESFPFFFRG